MTTLSRSGFMASVALGLGLQAQDKPDEIKFTSSSAFISPTMILDAYGEFRVLSKDGIVLATMDKDGKVVVVGPAEEIVRVVVEAMQEHLRFTREQYERDQTDRRTLNAATDRYEKSLRDVIVAQAGAIAAYKKEIAAYKKAMNKISGKGKR
jgi:hypothetical protein